MYWLVYGMCQNSNRLNRDYLLTLQDSLKDRAYLIFCYSSLPFRPSLDLINVLCYTGNSELRRSRGGLFEHRFNPSKPLPIPRSGFGEPLQKVCHSGSVLSLHQVCAQILGGPTRVELNALLHLGVPANRKRWGAQWPPTMQHTMEVA